MRNIKKFLLMAVLLMVYIFAIALLVQNYYIYQMAYQNLSRLISHPSIELQYNTIEQGEE